MSYTYGTSGVSNGMVTSVMDELSGIVQNISYIGSGNGIGQVYDVQELRAGSTDNTVTYTYNSSGDRDPCCVRNPATTEKW